VAYKRPTLLLYDPERLFRILTNSQLPVQLVLAGKAHPADHPGQAMIQQWMHFIHRPGAGNHVVFLSDYDMLLTEKLVQGVDVWINTPRRPWEACGTSGMKVLVNGGLNLSELDGWWAEAYTPEVGWPLGDGKEHDEEPSWDAVEAEALYTLLEQKVVPEFYTRNETGIPVAWVARIRESMARLTPQFSANRAVCDYTDQYYIKAAKTYDERAADNCAIGLQVAKWQRLLAQKWEDLQLGEIKIETDRRRHLFEIQVFFNGLNPDAVRIELYAEDRNGSAPVKQEMIRSHRLMGTENGYVYAAQVSADRTATDYTVRALPHFPGVVVPLEDNHILWQR
jgi:starch phosphorylase